MSTDLVVWVSSRLESDHKLSDEAKLLILAALEGRSALADMAGYSAPVASLEQADEVEPAGAFLKQIKVRGFRGIGPSAQLDLDPFPSLTVISGRNGSGKSSLAEALELALTGTTYRWHARTGQWKERWRNVHDGDTTHIEVTLAEEGVGATRLAADWPPGVDLANPRLSLQRQGEKKQVGVEALGWSGPLATYRPLLTYEELGALLTAEPKVLYDALSTVLGLEQLTRAVKALDEHRKVLVAPEASLRSEKRALLQELSVMDDERAGEAAELLAAGTTDVDRLRHLATGTTAVGGLGVRLRAITSLSVPEPEVCARAAEELTAAVGALAEVADQVGDALQRRDHLIQAVLAVHEHEGDQACPVCAGGLLDRPRAEHLRSELAHHQEQMSALHRARERQRVAIAEARRIVTPSPSLLAAPLPDPAETHRSAAVAAWETWAAAPAEPLALAEHLTSQSGPLRAAVGALRSSAADQLVELDEAWSRLAVRLATYADGAEKWAKQAEAAAAATVAHKWLKANEIVLKNERVKPIAAAAKHIWASLRQESNVEIAGLTLESSNTRRHVAITAEVDGEETGALAVMSQGELHALALALFLPRATAAQSPFRFVVLDDPVQAMDPAKVDGLVNVLLDIAKTRQVVVFSHDDQFASAVRRAPKGAPVKVLEVVREANSKVTCGVTYSPADRYLRDAFGLVKDRGLPDVTLHRVLPGLLRLALEAQSRDTYFARELSEGAPHAEVERVWEESRRTRERLGLALGSAANVDDWLAKAAHRSWALKKANAVHSGLQHGDPMDACRDVEKTLRDLRTGAK